MRNSGRTLAKVLAVILLVLEVLAGFAAIASVPVAVAVLLGLGTMTIDAQVPADARWVLPWMFIAVACASLAFFLLIRALRKLVASVRAGDAFALTNATAVRHVALYLALTQLAIMPLSAFAAMMGGAAPTWRLVEWDIMPWIGVLVVLVLAEVFAEGARLREDAEMVV